MLVLLTVLNMSQVCRLPLVTWSMVNRNSYKARTVIDFCGNEFNKLVITRLELCRTWLWRPSILCKYWRKFLPKIKKAEYFMWLLLILNNTWTCLIMSSSESPHQEVSASLFVFCSYSISIHHIYITFGNHCSSDSSLFVFYTYIFLSWGTLRFSGDEFRCLQEQFDVVKPLR